MGGGSDYWFLGEAWGGLLASMCPGAVLEGYTGYCFTGLSEMVIGGMTGDVLRCRFNGGTEPVGCVVDGEQHFRLEPLMAPPPARGATGELGHLLLRCGISIHAPARGATAKTNKNPQQIQYIYTTLFPHPPHLHRAYVPYSPTASPQKGAKHNRFPVHFRFALTGSWYPQACKCF